MRRRDFIKRIAGSAAAWPLAARAAVGRTCHRPVSRRLRECWSRIPQRHETGYVEGQNVVVEYHWLAGQYDRVPALMADLSAGMWP